MIEQNNLCSELGTVLYITMIKNYVYLFYSSHNVFEGNGKAKNRGKEKNMKNFDDEIFRVSTILSNN